MNTVPNDGDTNIVPNDGTVGAYDLDAIAAELGVDAIEIETYDDRSWGEDTPKVVRGVEAVIDDSTYLQAQYQGMDHFNVLQRYSMAVDSPNMQPRLHYFQETAGALTISARRLADALLDQSGASILTDEEARDVMSDLLWASVKFASLAGVSFRDIALRAVVKHGTQGDWDNFNATMERLSNLGDTNELHRLTPSEIFASWVDEVSAEAVTNRNDASAEVTGVNEAARAMEQTRMEMGG